ncbi:MAG: hypothetical protein IKQ90_07860 [Ruminococcus sp.]|nr:hypothetical protein [Ruminococcus sp.]
MDLILLTVSNKPASEGIGSVIVSALLAIGAMALIYGVLELLNRRNRKNTSDSAKPPVQQPHATFKQVLDRKMREKEEKDRSDEQ